MEATQGEACRHDSTSRLTADRGAELGLVVSGDEPAARLPWSERVWRAVVWLGFGPNAPMGVDEFGHLIAAPYRPRPAWDRDTTDVHLLHVDTWAGGEAA